MMHDRFVSVTIILLNNLKNPFLFCIEHFIYVALFSGFHILHVFVLFISNVFKMVSIIHLLFPLRMVGKWYKTNETQMKILNKTANYTTTRQTNTEKIIIYYHIQLKKLHKTRETTMKITHKQKKPTHGCMQNYHIHEQLKITSSKRNPLEIVYIRKTK